MLIMVDAKENWPIVLPGLQEIQTEQQTPWSPDDLLRMCEDKEAALFLAEDGDGFLIAQPRIAKYTGEKLFYIVACHGEGICQDKYREYVNTLAEIMGAGRIVMTSQRRGFERAGWDLDEIVFSRKVTPRETPDAEVSNGQE